MGNMEELSRRVNAESDEIERSLVRPIVKNAFLCSAKCCDKSQTSAVRIQRLYKVESEGKCKNSFMCGYRYVISCGAVFLEESLDGAQCSCIKRADPSILD